MKAEMVDDDKKWQAESDARTIADYHKISADPKRLEAATNAAGKLADDKKAEAESMMMAAGMKDKIKESMMAKKGGDHDKLA